MPVRLYDGKDLTFYPTYNTEDTGDIVWRYSNGNEMHRLWASTSIKPSLSYRHNGLTEYQLLHTGNSLIVESGNSVNGEYLKFSDGTLICFNSLQVTTSVDALWGNIFINPAGITLTFPHSFVPGKLSIAPVAKSSVGGDAMWCMYTDVLITGFTARLLRGATLSSRDITINYIAIGRWK